MNTQENRQACVNFQKKIRLSGTAASVYGELDATKLREQQALAERDAATAEIEKLKALLAAKQS
jgi:hypothetical protein